MTTTNRPSNGDQNEPWRQKEKDNDPIVTSDFARWSFLDSMRDGAYGVDNDGRCLFVNAAAISLLGYDSAEDLVGRNMHDLIHHTRADGSPYPRGDCPLLRAEGEGHPILLERETLWRRDGSPFLAQYSSYLLDGGRDGVSIVTLRELSSEAGATDDDLIGGSLPASPDCIFSIDGEGRVVDFGTVAEATFGLRPSVIGRDLVDTVFAKPHRDAVRTRISEALAGNPAALRSNVEVDAVQSDGSILPVELVMLRSRGRRNAKLAVHLRDISGRRRDQQLARQAEARFMTMANGIPQLSWIAGSDGAITWYNLRWYEYTGTVFADMQGWGWKSVHHPDHVERVERRLRHCFETGEVWEDTFPLRAKDGSYGWFLSRANPIRDQPDAEHPSGRILGWFGTNTDITAMRDAERKLEEARDEAEGANRAKSTFIANMSHELRTPLSAIIGYAEMVAEEIEDGTEPVDLAKDVQKIESNARHLLGLINDVLDLSKVESGKMDAYAETFDVATLAQDVAATIGALTQKNGNRFELRLADGLGTMHSDVTRIRQILLNLLGNAAKFTENGVIALAVSRRADRIAFAVEDDGIGMEPEQLERLFQRFQQADASTTRQFGGTGLGLALTRAFASLLGGEIEVRSTKGQGSTFIVELPAMLPQTMQSPEPPSEIGPVARGDAGERDVVLVIDDDETQRDLMSRFLLREGYAARAVGDGASGLLLAKRLRPRAILLDVTMPGMDGWSVLSALKADQDLAAIPVVMVTFVSERALATSLGAADYVIKPVDWSRLRHVMEAFRDAEGDVLIIDDEADMRRIARQALEKNGWSVVEAENGVEGLDQVARSVPRVILLDLSMPVMDGFEFLGRLREKPGCSDIPVVVLSALDLTSQDRRRLRGASQILNKGDTPMSDLADRLRRLGSAATPS